MKTIFNDEESKRKVIEKTQLKRETFKIFGTATDDLTVESNENIFNDFDFYQTLLKDFLLVNDGTANDQVGDINGTDQNGDMYLEGADLGMT